MGRKSASGGAHAGSVFPKKVIIIIAAVAGVLLAALIALAVYTFTCDNAFANITVGGEKVAGMSRDDIAKMLEEHSAEEYKAVEFDIRVGDNTTHVTAADLKAERDSAAAADAAIAIGRTGSAPKRMWDVFTCLVSKKDISPSALLDEGSLTAVLGKVSEQNDIAPVHAGYVIKNDVMTLTPPKDGVRVDTDALKAKIRESFDTDTFEDIEITTVVDKANVLDMDEVYKAVHTDVQDASMKEEGGEHKISPHVVGVDFDLAAAKKLHSENPDKPVDIKLTMTQPKVTTLMLQSTLFKDTLSTVTTYFSPKKVARTHNVSLAAKFINGKVLNPGETFSYNETVGPRTAARGFKEAQIFSQGEIVDGLGGGICQVSSTLYMAAMKADMKTVSRKNHSFYVDYAPKGQDATVVYGSIDFKFQNTSPYPIKIVAYQKNNYIKVTIMGTITQKKTVKLQTKTLATKPFTEKIVEDPSLKPGERVIDQKGQEGITMEVYRLVYDANGKLLSNTFENKTKYVPLTQIVRVGPAAASTSAPAETKPVEEKPAETKPEEKPQDTQTPAQPQTDTPAGESGDEGAVTEPDQGSSAESTETQAPAMTPDAGNVPAENTEPDQSSDASADSAAETPAE